MTKQELLSLDHLSIAEVKKFVHIHTEEGYFMTSWTDEKDIKEYAGSVCYYMPIRDEYEDYRIITLEEHNELESRRDAAIKEEEERYLAENKRNE
jgi:hypothetical protein